MTDNAIVPVNENAIIRPVMSINDAVTTYNDMVEFTRQALKENQDYGVIPGTSKNTLLKPGAEKLCRFFGLSPRFRVEKEIENWEAEEPFFYYRIHCTLYRLGTDIVVAEGFGSCNSKEKKYRWRTSDRTCPNCGETAIIKGKAEYGGGWLCWSKRGGCGSKFSDSDPAIIDQPAGSVINPDMEDLPNTLLKMAKKRAFIDATLTATNASEFYTQDMEDYDFSPVGNVIDSTAEVVETRQAAHDKPTLVEPSSPTSKPVGKPSAQTRAQNIRNTMLGNVNANPDNSPCLHAKFFATLGKFFSDDQERYNFTRYMFGVEHYDDLSDPQRNEMCVWGEKTLDPHGDVQQVLEALDAETNVPETKDEAA